MTWIIHYQYLVVKVFNDPAQWLSWLERRPVTAEVTGSSPVWVVYVVTFCRKATAYVLL